jgi:large subunit ribosomal protein L29
MKHLKAKELRSKSITELEDLVRQERADLFKARRDLALRQLSDTASLKIRRHNIARALTVIAEKQKEGKA